MASITYTDKVQLQVNPNPDVNQWRAVDANEVKNVVNTNETALGLKANIASPIFTGVPEAPTALEGTDTTQLATTEFVQDAVDLSLVSVTGAIGLGSTAFGKLHLCSGTSTDYTVDLPTAVGNTGKTIGFKGVPALTKVVTIDGLLGETIDGELTRQIGAYGILVVCSDGANWNVVHEVGSWIPWTPTFPTHTGTPTHTAFYFRTGKTWIIQIDMTGTNTSNATTFTIDSMPFTSGAGQRFMIANIVNAGVTQTTPGQCQIGVGSTTLTITRNMDGSTAWTASGTKRVTFTATFRSQ